MAMGRKAPSRTDVTRWHTALGQDPLPELNVARSECARLRQQAVKPHAVKAIPELVAKLGSRRFKIGVPGHQGFVVVGAKIVQQKQAAVRQATGVKKHNQMV